MYLISQVFKETVSGGTYYCQVFYCTGVNLSDVTDQIAEEFGYSLEDNSIAISFGSGTGFNRIEQSLTTDKEGNILSDIRVADVSVFNQ